LLSLPMFLNSM